MRSSSWLACAAIAISCTIGCAKARVVEVSQQGGVVAIPSNSNSWPFYHRDKAEELIRERCPDGYEIVREEEVVTGQVAHTQSRTDRQRAPRLDLGKLPHDKDPDNKAATLAGLSIPLGSSREDTDVTTRYTDVKEYHIHYRPKVR